MDSIERLSQYQTLQENHLGFKGILSGVAEELIPEGYVPDMENLEISTEGIVEAVQTPSSIAAPTGISSGALALFMWKKDDGTEKLIAQYGRRLFKYYGSTWTEIRRIGTTISADITSTSVTSISVAAASALAMPFTIKIDSEIMNVTAGGGTTTWTVTRGFEGTTAATHSSGANVMVEALCGPEKAAFAGGMGNNMYVVNRTTQLSEYNDTTLTYALPPSGATVSHGPMGDYLTIWKNRIFVGGKIKWYGNTSSAGGTPATTDYAFGVCWSNVLMTDEEYARTVTGDTSNSVTDAYDGGFPADGYLQLRTAENSQITGMMAVEENLYIFLESAIFVFSGYSNDTFNSSDVYHGANTPKQNAIIRAGGIYYISDDGIYALSDNPKKISVNIDKFIDTSGERQACAYYNNRLWFATNGKIVAMNINTGTWEKYNIAGQDLVYGSGFLYITKTDGTIYDFSSRVSGSYLDWYLSTPVLNQGITAADKRYKSMFIYHKALADAINIKIYADYSDSPLVLSPDVTSDVTGAYFNDVAEEGALIWGEGLWSAMSSDMEISLRYMYLPPARTIKIYFSGVGNVGLLGYAIVFKPKRKYGVR